MKSTPLADVSSIVDAQCGDGNLAVLLLSYFPKFARSSERTMLRDSSCLTLVAPIALLSDMERALDGLILRFFVIYTLDLMLPAHPDSATLRSRPFTLLTTLTVASLLANLRLEYRRDGNVKKF
ncbi:uncharacterized protein FOMMEDRAFT_154368 [Fomitiporia mediterranea MF3/22]|uniref:uncharacterized protein n=1 Tax=Fomitiporia mediterranea (strain MF3/22) TaxID=694068 RepID=UPI0004408EBF|nr:uncharacterized protein FOMMEDRAFT_154368 [Fomitiporia mediterranea MF3/22]EJD05163.1 hypothetical protein FOMMEDRAFT_154368 [Fomitiporia mediterranea MF3/22]